MEGDRKLFETIGRHIPYRYILFYIPIINFIIKILIIPFPTPKTDISECYTPPTPIECGYIFDESYYVPTALKLLDGIPYNLEHPPLAKFIIASTIKVFGWNPYGWRISPIIFHTLTILIIGYLTYELTHNYFSSIISQLLLLSDVLTFIVGQIAILDIYTIFFIVAGYYLMIKDRIFLSSISFGLALSSKLLAVPSIFGFLLYPYLKNMELGWKKAIQRWIYGTILFLSISTLIFISIVYLYNIVTGAFEGNFIEHIGYMLSYHSKLKYSDPSKVILPHQWILPYPYKRYYYYGLITNKYLYRGGPIAYISTWSPIWPAIWIAIPYLIYRVFNLRDYNVSPFLLTIISYMVFYSVLAYILMRYVYPFYYTYVIPYLAISLSIFREEGELPGILVYALLTLEILWFISYFPVLPINLF